MDIPFRIRYRFPDGSVQEVEYFFRLHVGEPRPSAQQAPPRPRPKPQPAPKPVPPCLAALGLTHGATVADVRRAYRRLSLKAHPDQGGTHEGFLRLQRAYEEALGLCRK